MLFLFRRIRHYDNGSARFVELHNILATCKIISKLVYSSIHTYLLLLLYEAHFAANECVLRAKNNGVQGTRVWFVVCNRIDHVPACHVGILLAPRAS